MKYTFFLFLLLNFSFTTISAQQDHFLYFQTENNQAFYVKLGTKVYSSSASGYLILPKLKEGNYKMVFGFPKNQWPEEVINYTLEKDEGFVLKNSPDKGWGLFDLQSSNVIMPGEQLAAAVVKNENGRQDNFSNMLAAVVNDSSIKQTDIPAKQVVSSPLKEKNPEVSPPEQKRVEVDSSKEKSTEIIPSKEKSVEESGSENIVKEGAPVADTATATFYSVITRDLQLKNVDGIDMVYTDEFRNDKDTIRIFMPFEGGKSRERQDSGKGENQQLNNEVNQADAVTLTDQPPIIETDTIKARSGPGMADAAPVKELLNDTLQTTTGIAATNNEEIKTDTSMADRNSKKDAAKDNIELLPANSGMINSNCRQYATAEDFMKLRKKMAAESDDDKMITAAKKIFKTRCFTVKDIKNLSALFLNDAGKYNFFDAAYPYVSDSDLFYTLESQLADEYYVKRFEAMIHH